jgi:hypothetical protein
LLERVVRDPVLLREHRDVRDLVPAVPLVAGVAVGLGAAVDLAEPVLLPPSIAVVWVVRSWSTWGTMLGAVCSAID